MKFFSPNIGRTGRIVRALAGLVFVAVGLVLHGYSFWLCLALVLAGLFTLFEAARGWCFARACGIRTKL